MSETDTGISEADKCCEEECRVEKEDYFAVCSFEISQNDVNRKVIDLTWGTDLSFDELNLRMCNEYKEFERKAKAGLSAECIKNDTEEIAKRWILPTYFKLVSEQLFIRLDTKNKSHEYAPFHCFAQYFISQGYDGIIFSSTLCEGAKNVVLFNREYAKPTGTIKQYKI